MTSNLKRVEPPVVEPPLMLAFLDDVRPRQVRKLHPSDEDCTRILDQGEHIVRDDDTADGGRLSDGTQVSACHRRVDVMTRSARAALLVLFTLVVGACARSPIRSSIGNGSGSAIAGNIPWFLFLLWWCRWCSVRGTYGEDVARPPAA